MEKHKQKLKNNTFDSTVLETVRIDRQTDRQIYVYINYLCVKKHSENDSSGIHRKLIRYL